MDATRMKASPSAYFLVAWTTAYCKSHDVVQSAGRTTRSAIAELRVLACGASAVYQGLSGLLRRAMRQAQ